SDLRGRGRGSPRWRDYRGRRVHEVYRRDEARSRRRRTARTMTTKLDLDEELRIAACVLPEESTHRDLLLRAAASIGELGEKAQAADRAIRMTHKHTRNRPRHRELQEALD